MSLYLPIDISLEPVESDKLDLKEGKLGNPISRYTKGRISTFCKGRKTIDTQVKIVAMVKVENKLLHTLSQN